MVEQGTAAVVLQPHRVAFHGSDAELIEIVAPYVAEGLDLDERVVVVLTDPHRAALDEALHERGIDSTRARRSGTYLPWGAEETLRTFLVDGSLDRERFIGTIGGLLGPAPQAAPVRAFGEMVAVLWERGQVAAALELEDLWNDLLRTRPLSLLCAYSAASLGDARLGDVGRLCEVHGTLLPPAGYADLVPGGSRHPRRRRGHDLVRDVPAGAVGRRGRPALRHRDARRVGSGRPVVGGVPGRLRAGHQRRAARPLAVRGVGEPGVRCGPDRRRGRRAGTARATRGHP